MTALPLRLRVFLLFAALAAGGIAAAWGGLWLGWRQLGAPGAASAFVSAGAVAGFGMLAVAAGIWMLFDENVAKPVEALAASLRLGGRGAAPEAEAARYLGDLGPAAADLHARLAEIAQAGEEGAPERIERLERHQRHLLRILSDIPVAVLVLTRAHQIALYDGQAAALLAEESAARLGGSLFDHLEEGAVLSALAQMEETGEMRRPIAVTGRSGAAYSGHLRRFDESGCYTLMLESLSPEDARPLTFDLDLLDAELPADTLDAPLRSLCFTVFDTETTGLDPKRDAVVQIGAARVLGARVVEGERFETLVDPGRPIPPASTKVHGIADADVTGAPPWDEVRRAFHGFASGSVLVAHNAPFDMSFLAGAEPPFDHAVIDTVHLSAIVFGGSAEHTLDALCARLGIEIPPALRHTAMGDALATAEALAALIPVLEAKGIETLGEAKAEARKHSRILRTHEAEA